MAALEREQIGEATKLRVESARQAGKHLGRKNSASTRQVNKVRELREQGLRYQAITKQTQLSYGTVFAIYQQSGGICATSEARQSGHSQQMANVDENKRPVNNDSVSQV